MSGLLNYPAGVDNGHPHFHPPTTCCPHCGCRVEVAEECEGCGKPLDEDAEE